MLVVSISTLNHVTVNERNATARRAEGETGHERVIPSSSPGSGRVIAAAALQRELQLSQLCYLDQVNSQLASCEPSRW